MSTNGRQSEETVLQRASDQVTSWIRSKPTVRSYFAFAELRGLEGYLDHRLVRVRHYGAIFLYDPTRSLRGDERVTRVQEGRMEAQLDRPLRDQQPYWPSYLDHVGLTPFAYSVPGRKNCLVEQLHLCLERRTTPKRNSDGDIKRGSDGRPAKSWVTRFTLQEVEASMDAAWEQLG